MPANSPVARADGPRVAAVQRRFQRWIVGAVFVALVAVVTLHALLTR
jgi:hypothetical protein